MIKIGVTGTRDGMNKTQLTDLSALLKSKFTAGSEFHHGDCVGVDVEAAKVAKELGYRIICHPPEEEKLRGYFESDEYRTPDSYFARNRDIVNDTSMLIVIPYQDSPQRKGGTWYTHNYAVKVGKPVNILYPGRQIENNSV